MHVRNFWKVGWKGARLGEGDQFGSRDSKPGKRQRRYEADSMVVARRPGRDVLWTWDEFRKIHDVPSVAPPDHLSILKTLALLI